MKKLISVSVLCCALLTTSMCLASEDKLNIAGTYKCTGYDSYSGRYTGTVVLKPDFKASDFKNNFGAYSFSLSAKIPGDSNVYDYTGEAAAHGDSLAIYYKNIDPKAAIDDQGVGIASIVRDQDAKGNVTVSFHKFYFEPQYLRDKKGPTGKTGGTGTENCVRVSK